MIAYFLGGCAIYGIVLFVLVMLRPKSALHTKKLIDCGRREKITIGVVLVILILLCTLPMGLAPGWNGEDGIYLTDLSSVNGVFLNRKRLIKEHSVLCRVGDIVSFADITYLLCTG